MLIAEFDRTGYLSFGSVDAGIAPTVYGMEGRAGVGMRTVAFDSAD